MYILPVIDIGEAKGGYWRKDEPPDRGARVLTNFKDWMEIKS